MGIKYSHSYMVKENQKNDILLANRLKYIIILKIRIKL